MPPSSKKHPESRREMAHESRLRRTVMHADDKKSTGEYEEEYDGCNLRVRKECIVY